MEPFLFLQNSIVHLGEWTQSGEHYIIIDRGKSRPGFTFSSSSSQSPYILSHIPSSRLPFINFNQKMESGRRSYEFLLQNGQTEAHSPMSQQDGYYLCMEDEFGEKQFTPCVGLENGKAYFRFTAYNQIRQVEIWNYERARKIATVLLKKVVNGTPFTYDFKNWRLRLSVYLSNLHPSKQIREGGDSVEANTSESESSSRCSQE